MTPSFCVFIAASLDGFIARPDGGLDWLDAVQTPDEDYGYQAFFDSVDALLLGSSTYETVRGFPEWPYADKPCYVATSQERRPVRHESFVRGNPVVLARQLAEKGHSRVYLDGGRLIRSFLATGLVTELILSVVPILLGAGIPLFREIGKEPGYGEHTLKATGSQTYPSGLIQLRYTKA
jgi:dihydrofolate reductase